MSWAQWPGVPAQQPPVVAAAAPLVNPAPSVMPPGLPYTADQWSQMQQQNWQQWAQWQQQYQQWHQQYGAEYQKSMNALAAQQNTVPNLGVPPPLPAEPQPPLPPQEEGIKPPLPTTTQQPSLGSYSTQAPPSNNFSAPPPNFIPNAPPKDWRSTEVAQIDQKRSLGQADESSNKRQMVNRQGWKGQSTSIPTSSVGLPPVPSKNEELSEAEKKFDKQFAEWEAQFNKWKDQNSGHPDKQQYREYEKKWEQWRQQLLDRREAMRRKRLGLVAPPKGAPLTQNFNVPPPSQGTFNTKVPPPVMTQGYSVRNQPLNTASSAAPNVFTKPPPDMNDEPLQFKKDEKEEEDQEGGLTFLNTSKSDGIPGLDLVEEGDKEQVEDEPVVEKGPDLEAISKGINNILGDQKLMSMLSMVSQNQNQNTNISTNTKVNDPFPLDQSNLSTEDSRNERPYIQAETVQNFDDQTRSSFTMLPHDTDFYRSGPPPTIGGQREASFDNESSFRGPLSERFDNPPPPLGGMHDEQFRRPPPTNRFGPISEVELNKPPPLMGRHSSIPSLLPPRNIPNDGPPRRESFSSTDGGFRDEFNRQEGRGMQGRDSFGPPSNRNDFSSPGMNRFGRPPPEADRGRFGARSSNDDFEHNMGREDYMGNNEGRRNFDERPFNKFDYEGDGGRDSRDQYFDEYEDEANGRGYNDDFYDRPPLNRGTGRNDEFEGPPSSNFNNTLRQNDAQGPRKAIPSLLDNLDDRFPPHAENMQNFQPKHGRDDFNFRDNPSDRFSNRMNETSNFRNERDFNHRGDFRNDYGDEENYPPAPSFDRGGPLQRTNSFGNQMADAPEPPMFDRPPVVDNFGEGYDDNQFSQDKPEKDVAAEPVAEEELWKPSSVIDYDHKPLVKPQELDILVEPFRMFDYRHKTLRRIPFSERPNWLSDSVRMIPEFDPPKIAPPSVDRRFGDRFEPPPRREDRSHRPDNDFRYERGGYGMKFSPPPSVSRERDYDDDSWSKRRKRSISPRSRDERDRSRNRDRMRDRDMNQRNRMESNRNDWEREEDMRRDSPHDSRGRVKDVRGSRDWEQKDNRNRSGRDWQNKERELERAKEWEDDDMDLSAEEKDVRYDNKRGDRYAEREKFNSEEKNIRFDNKRTGDRHAERDNFNRKPSGPLFPVGKPEDPKKINNVTSVEELINPPGRLNRPPRIVIIMRGPPGSGKTYLAKLIKDKEVENGGSAPRILSLDDYFMVEQEKEIIEDGKRVKTKDMVYEFEAEMEDSYRTSLMRSFKKTITDGYFNFIIVDNVNDKVKYFGEMWSFAKQNGFQVYICQLDLDIQNCIKRNIHNRSEGEIRKCVEAWENTPSHHPILDASSLLEGDSIAEVEMEEINSGGSDNDDEEGTEDRLDRSKWDNFDCSINNLARLDGVNKPLRPSRTMEEYLQLGDEWQPTKPTKPGQKRVRWADLEECKQQEKMRAIGFVVGQTDWDRMMDPTMGEGALTQTRFIDKVQRRRF